MQIAGRTDRGLVRELNEDSIFFSDSLFIVADGMGGHLAGDVASADAINCVKVFSAENSDNIKNMLGEAIKYANKNIYAKAQSDARYKGMGTTVTLALIEGEELFYAHIGDSRLYLFRQQNLEKITSDHSLVAELLQSGQITAEQAEQHPNKNVITKAVGSTEDIAPDEGHFALEPEDIILLCSDGLTNMLKKEHIAEIILANKENLEDIVDCLVDCAKKAGGTDNISVICCKY